MQVEQILENISDAFFALDKEGCFIYLNRPFEKMFQCKRRELLGKKIWEEFPLFKENPFQDMYKEAIKSGQPVRLELLYFPLCKWIVMNASPSPDGMFVYITDYTPIKKEEEAQKFLNQASEVLSSSLDYETTLSNVAHLAVPHVADWCAVHIKMEDGSLHQLAIQHIEEEKRALAREFNEKYPNDPADRRGIYGVIKSGKPEVIPVITDEMLAANAIDPTHLTLLRALGLKSYMIVPLIARESMLGALTFIRSDSDAPFDQKDLRLAEELARRAALAVDNARLYKAAEESREKLELAQKAGRIGSFEWNVKTGHATWTKELEALYGLKPGGFKGKYENWLKSIHPDDQQMIEQAIKEAIAKRADVDLECRVCWPDKSLHWIAIKAHSYFEEDTGSLRLVGVNMDITDRRHAEETMRYQAFHDSLTSLPNRLLLNDRLKMALQHARRKKEKLAIIFLDLDRFKDINDTLGHSVGDLLLTEVAKRLAGAIKTENTIARFGGDEFLIMLPDIDDVKEVIKAAKKVFKIMQPAFFINKREIHLNISMGIAIYPHDGGDVDTLMKNADTALYQAKEAGRNKYQLYTQVMHLQTSERLALENDLRKALERNEFVLYYQPIVDVKTGAMVRSEALVRWQHPKRGLLPPEKFIPLAEETGFIVPLGELILKTITKQMKIWKDNDLPDMRVAINLSARQFSQDDLPERLETILKRGKVDPNCIQIEITESAVMQNLTVGISKLKKLKELGVQVVIDDFGTGHSSLSYLKKLPIDRLKIDKSFIKQCTTDQRDAAIVKAIISMAHTLNLTVCAEGVETKKQWAFLKTVDCNTAQGYLFSKPLPFAEYVRRGKVNPIRLA